MVRFNRKLVRSLVAVVLIGLTSCNLTAGVRFTMMKQKLVRFVPAAFLISLFSSAMLAANANLAKLKEKLHLTKQQANANTNGQSAEDAEKKRVKEVIALVSAFANRSKQRADDFFSTGNRESYSTHVGKFAADLRDLDEQLIKPIQQMVQNTPAGSAHKVIIEKIHSIITKLYSNLNELQTSLNSGCSLGGPSAVKALKLGLTLKTLKGKIGPTVDQLNIEINRLYELTRQYDSEISQHVEILRNEFQAALNNNANPDVILRALKHRFDC